MVERTIGTSAGVEAEHMHQGRDICNAADRLFEFLDLPEHQSDELVVAGWIRKRGKLLPPVRQFVALDLEDSSRVFAPD